MLQPKQLLCTVAREAIPIVEVWFVGGRGTDAHPLEVEVLGDLDGEAAPRVVDALERLMDTHGPFLAVDLSAIDRLDAHGFALLTDLRSRAADRPGRVVLADLPPAFGHLSVAMSHRSVPEIPHRGTRMSSSMPPQQPVDSATAGTTADVLHLHGELDSDNSADLDAQLRAFVEGQPGDVTIDLSDVSFIDSTVISCLLRLHADVGQRGGRLLVRNPTRAVRRVLEITGLLEIFGVE